MFESIEGGETWGRYSIIGLPCKRRYHVRGHEISVHDDSEPVSVEHVPDPLVRIEEIRFSPESDRVSYRHEDEEQWFSIEVSRTVNRD